MSAYNVNFDAGRVNSDGPTFSDARTVQLKPHIPHVKPRNVMLIVGVIVLIIVSTMPVMQCVDLLEDPAFVFLIGRSHPWQIIIACFFSIPVYVLLVVVYFGCARDDAKMFDQLLTLSSVVLATLGICFLLSASPLQYDSEISYNSIMTNCQFSEQTQKLYEYATVLQGIRADPACAAQYSVESCDGYQESLPYTGFMRSIEQMYHCSGFCYTNATAKAAAAAVSLATNSSQPAAASLLSKGAQPRLNGLTMALQRIAMKQKVKGMDPPVQDLVPSLLQLKSERTAPARAETFADSRQLFVVGQHRQDPAPLATTTTTTTAIAVSTTPGALRIVYPLALFSNYSKNVSCDGSMARQIKFESIYAAEMIYWEGVLLISSVVVGSFFRLCGLCNVASPFTKRHRRDTSAMIQL